MSDPASWDKPGHPGKCPRCGEYSVHWTWKPDLNPTTERIICMGCGLDMVRAYVPTRLQLDLTTTQIAVIRAALNFWDGAAQRKHDRIRQMQVEAEDAGRELTISEQADVDYINGMLPIRLEASKQIHAQIKEKANRVD